MQKPPGNSTLFYRKDFFNDFSDDKSDNLFQQCIEKDISWSVAGGLPDKENKMLLLGSRTPFQKELTIELIRTCAYQGVRNVSFSENFAYVLNE